MTKLTKQNVGGTDFSVVGCALSATCASAASDYIKTATLTDGDSISDGMMIRCLFTYENTAGTAPDVLTIYSSDQVNYFSDAGLTQPFTLAPTGCYSVSYTGTGNAYYYKSWVCLSVGGVTAMVTLPNTGEAGGTLWDEYSNVVFLYSDGKFRLMNVGVDRIDVMNSNPISVRGAVKNYIHGIRDFWTTDSNNPFDIITLVESYTDLLGTYDEEIKIRVGSYATNSPYGAGVQNCDFYYDIRKVTISNNNWIRVIAYDVRDNQMYENAKIDGTWWGWRVIQRVDTAHLTNSVISDNNIPIQFVDTLYRNGIYTLIGHIGGDYNTPVAVTEGMIIGHLNPGQNLTPVVDFPVNVHNFGTNEDFLLWIYATGNIQLFACGTRSIILDFYINTTYNK